MAANGRWAPGAPVERTESKPRGPSHTGADAQGEDDAMRVRRGGRIVGVGLVAVLGLAACDGGEEEPTAPATPAQTPTPTATPTPTPTAEPTPEPTPESQTHVVESGETLSGIAARFGTTVDAIVEANGIEDPDHLAVGEELVIPPAP